MVLSGSRTSGSVSKNSSKRSRSRGSSRSSVSAAARARAQRLSSLSSGSSSSSNKSSGNSNYNPKTGFGHTPTGFRKTVSSTSTVRNASVVSRSQSSVSAAARARAQRLSSLSRNSTTQNIASTAFANGNVIVKDGKRIDPRSVEGQQIAKILARQKATRKINAEQKKLFWKITNAKNAAEVNRIRQEAMRKNPNVGTRNVVIKDGKVVSSSGRVGVGDAMTAPGKKPARLIVTTPKPTEPKFTKFPKPIPYNHPKKPNPAPAGTIQYVTKDSIQDEIPQGISIPKKQKTSEDVARDLLFVSPKVKKPEPQIGEPHQEYAKGFRDGVDDLRITGENVVRYAQGKELLPQKGNTLDNLLFSPLDAGVKTIEDDSDFYDNFRKRVDKVSTDFWANPARSVGSSVPSALIIGASVIVPPIGAAKYGVNIASKAPKVASAISKGIKTSSKTTKVTTTKPRSLNKGKYGIGDEKSYAEATRKVVPVPKNRIRTGKAKSYHVNPSLLIRKDNIKSINIPKGVDLEPRTISQIFGRGIVKIAKRNSVKKIMDDNKKVSDRILNLGNKAKVKQPHKNSRASLGEPSGFGKVVKSGKQKLVLKTKQKTQPKWVSQVSKRQTSNGVKEQTKKLQNFYGKSGQVTKQVSKTVKKGSKSKSALKAGVRVGGLLGAVALGRKTKQKVRPIIRNPDPEKEKPKTGDKSKQDDKSTFAFNWKYGNDDGTVTVPITDDPPVEESIFVPAYRPPTTPTTTPKPLIHPSRKFGSGRFWGRVSGGRPKKVYTVNKIAGIFEATQIGKSIDSRTIPLGDYDKIMKSRKKKSNITGIMDYGLSKTKSKKKGTKKKTKKSTTRKKKNWWEL